jgi:hypothetical protein
MNERSKGQNAKKYNMAELENVIKGKGAEECDA